MADLALFRFSYPIDIRFADLDALQHVNHAKYFTYMETARIHYIRDILGWRGDQSALGVIIAEARCSYKLPLVFGNQATCYVRASRIGGKSFDFEYLIVRADGVLAAEGLTVNVTYDYVHQSSITVPDAWRVVLIEYEPGLRA